MKPLFAYKGASGMNKPYIAQPLRRSALIVSMFCFLLLSGQPAAHAGWWGTIKDISELPAEVNELKENYRQTVDQLEQAHQNMEIYRQENQKLLEQNQELTRMVAELKQLEEERQASYRKMKALVLTLAGLLIGYFVMLRGLRVWMRVRAR